MIQGKMGYGGYQKTLFNFVETALCGNRTVNETTLLAKRDPGAESWGERRQSGHPVLILSGVLGGDGVKDNEKQKSKLKRKGGKSFRIKEKVEKKKYFPAKWSGVVWLLGGNKLVWFPLRPKREEGRSWKGKSAERSESRDPHPCQIGNMGAEEAEKRKKAYNGLHSGKSFV